MAADPDSRWSSINANHMLPSGSSLFHPHLQGIVDPSPTTLQRQVANVPAARFDDYLDSERRAGVRFLGNSGRVQWLASFAPIAPAELRAFVPGIASPAELRAELVGELAHGLTNARCTEPRRARWATRSTCASRAARTSSRSTARTRPSWSGCIGRALSIWPPRAWPSASATDSGRDVAVGQATGKVRRASRLRLGRRADPGGVAVVPRRSNRVADVSRVRAQRPEGAAGRVTRAGGARHWTRKMGVGFCRASAGYALPGTPWIEGP